MKPEDARETYEMLHAAHTIMKMAFGACCMISKPKDLKDAKNFTSKWRAVFKIITDSASAFLELAKTDLSASDSAVN